VQRKIKYPEKVIKTKTNDENSHGCGQNPRKNKDSQKSPAAYNSRNHFKSPVQPSFFQIFDIRGF